MLPVDQEIIFRHRLLASGMACLIPISDIAVGPNSRSLINGAFAVWHKKGQRLIIDLRPANAGEARLAWLWLPLGPMLARYRLPPGYGLRVSRDDLESYFYPLLEAAGALPRRAVGRAFDSATAAWHSNLRQLYNRKLCLRLRLRLFT